MRPITFYDAFHGIGGFRLGLERAGMKCIGGCEYNKFACRAYEVIYGERCEPTDVRDVDPGSIQDFDALVFGWSCRSNSRSGKRHGHKRDSESGITFRGALNILRHKKPPYFIAENVEGLFSVSEGKDFYKAVRLFAYLGYDCQWQLVDTRWLLPQARERIIFVGHLRGGRRPEVFPFTDADLKAKGAVEDGPGMKLAGLLPLKGIDQWNRVYDPSGISPTLTTMRGGRQEPKIILPDGRMRKLTPLECFRIQGFPDEWYYKLKEHKISDAQLYKMAGNAVTSTMSEMIGERFVNSVESIREERVTG